MNISIDAATAEAETEMQQQRTEELPITTVSNPIETENTEANFYNVDDTLVNSHNASLTTQPGMSYASAFRSTGAVPKKVQPKPSTPKAKESFWTEQFQSILAYHNQGSRVLVIMRGVPGSGKSYLAKQIVAKTIGTSFVNYKTHICSTDDYFMVNGVYIYEKQRLSEAHEWNQNRVRAALEQGLSPVIVDNTNVEIWEMEPYLREGVKNGYFIEIMEPNTPWAKKFNQLLKRNDHNVPAATIRRMLNNFQEGLTGEFLIEQYRLSYTANMLPPVIRFVPAYHPPHSEASVHNLGTTAENVAYQYTVDNLQTTLLTKCTVDHNPSPTFRIEQTTVPENMVAGLEQESGNSLMTNETYKGNNDEEEAKQKSFLEFRKQLDEFEKVERDWENGEAWDETKDTTQSSVKFTEIETNVYPKPPRNYLISEGSTPRDDLLVTAVQSCDDWRDISMYMPPWNDNSLSQESKITEQVVETQSTGTSVEIGDGDLQNASNIFKIITTIPRDINLFYISPHKEKIPDKRTLDKSTITTNDDIMTEIHKCKNEDEHFNAFRKLFKNLPKEPLRDIFDKCCGDVNWAVDIVLGGTANNQLQIMDNDDSEISGNEEENAEQCIATCNVIPTPGESTKAINDMEQNIPDVPRNSVFVPTKRMRVIPSETAEALELKRQIEMNVVISDDHYSEHVQKIRKFRRGEFQADDMVEEDYTLPLDTQNVQHSSSKTEVASCRSDDDVSSCGSLDEVEKTVNVSLGMEFVLQLDNLFGRTGMTYPENVVPKINIPMSLLQEINAFWVESLMHQLDDHDKQKAAMIREDEEFAR